MKMQAIFSPGFRSFTYSVILLSAASNEVPPSALHASICSAVQKRAVVEYTMTSGLVIPVGS